MFLEKSLVHAGFGKQLGEKINRLKPVEVTFGDKPVDFGTIITPTQALQPPEVSTQDYSKSSYFLFKFLSSKLNFPSVGSNVTGW